MNVQLLAVPYDSAGITLSAYDPDGDSDGAAAEAAIRLISTAAAFAGGT
jgi:hypothetical protein